MPTTHPWAGSSSLLRLAFVAVALLALLYGIYFVAVRVSPAEAVFHLVQIDEVMAGAHGNPDIQFVEMRMCCGGQNTQGNNAKLVFFSSSGDQTGEFLFPSNPNGGTNVSFLISTQAFADLFTTPTPDFIMPPLVQPGSGKVCYKNLTGAGFEVNLCLSYGVFTGDTETDVRGDPAGPPGPGLPIAGATSLKRVANFGNFEAGQFNADFALSTPEPTNSLGETGTVSLPQTGDLILTKTAARDPVRLGTNLAYTIGVLNNSLSATTGVEVTDTLPLEVNFVSATPGCSGTSTVTCILGTMGSGDRATMTIVVTPTVTGFLNNTATVTGDQLDPNTGDNTATVTTTVNSPALAEVEPNDPVTSAQIVLIPASGTAEITGVLGTIGSGDVDDLDFYSFQGSTGDVVTVDIDNAIGGLQSFDSVVALFGPGPAFIKLIRNDDASLDPGSTSIADSRIDDFPLPSSGIFTVGVTNCCRNFQDGGTVLNPGIANGDYSLIISGVTPTPVTGGPPQLVTIAVTPGAASVPAGLTQQFAATGAFGDGSTGDLTASVAWASSNPLVATINTGGLATGVGVGTADITATSNGLTSNTATLTVTPADLVSIAVTPEAASIPVGANQQFTAVGSFSDGSTADVTAAATWESTTTQVTPTLVGGTGGPALAVAHGRVGGVPHVFFGTGRFVVAADVSDPASPVEVGRLVLPGVVNGLFFREADNLLFVASREVGGLRIVDVSDPSDPLELGHLDTPDIAWEVAVSGDLAFVANDSSGLRIVDISAPSVPVEVGFLDTPGNARGVAVSGDLAFVAAANGGLRIVDVTNPLGPVEAGVLDSRTSVDGVAVSGDLAFVAASGSGLLIVDVSTPATPVQVGSADTPGSALDVVVSGDLAFVAASGSGLRVFDVSNPSAPAEVGFLDTPGLSHDVLLSGTLAFLADDGGVRIVEVSNPGVPAQAGFLDTPGSTWDVVLSGDLAFVADQGSGLVILDLSNPVTLAGC